MSVRLDWAQAQYVKCSKQTQSDIDELVVEFRKSKECATITFRKLNESRKWKLFEAAALADIVKALAGA